MSDYCSFHSICSLLSRSLIPCSAMCMQSPTTARLCGGREIIESSGRPRPIQRSVPVGFMPNPEPTRPDRVGKLSTRRRPSKKSVWTGQNINERQSGSVGVEIWKIKKFRLENDENRSNPLSFRRKQPRSRIDLAKSRRIQPRTQLDLAKSHRILSRSSQKTSQNSPELSNTPGSGFLTELWVFAGRFEFFGFWGGKPANRPAGYGFWRRRTATDRHRRRVGRYSGRIRRFFRVGRVPVFCGQPQVDHIICPPFH